VAKAAKSGRLRKWVYDTITESPFNKTRRDVPLESLTGKLSAYMLTKYPFEPRLCRRPNYMKEVAGVRLVRYHVAVHDNAVGEGCLVDSLEGNCYKQIISTY
jgi:hypothetical protein